MIPASSRLHGCELLAATIHEMMHHYHQCTKYENSRPTDNGPLTSGYIRTFWKLSNDHKSTTGYPVFAISGWKSKMAAGGHFEKNFKWPYVNN